MSRPRGITVERIAAWLKRNPRLTYADIGKLMAGEDKRSVPYQATSISGALARARRERRV